MTVTPPAGGARGPWPWCWSAAVALWSGAAATRPQTDRRPIWIEPGEYKGPPDAASSTPAQVEAIGRAGAER